MSEIVLVVCDNDYHSQARAGNWATSFGYRAIFAKSSQEALSKIICDGPQRPDIVVIDMVRPDIEGLQLLQSLRICRPQLPVIMMVGQGDAKTMEQADALGVSDLLVRPCSAQQMRLSLTNIISLQRMKGHISNLERKHSGRVQFSDVIAESSIMRDVLTQARKAAAENYALWISGEAGTGKTLLAAAIHGSSVRAGEPFVTVECSSLAADASQYLFGGDKGKGKLAEAATGTLVLKNVAMLKPELQQRIHQRMQQARQQPQNSPRFILTAEAQVLSMASEGLALASPLFQDVCGAAIILSPLRERPQDISALASHALRVYSASENKKIRTISGDALMYLEQLAWPGNARELMHMVWRAVLLATHEVIETSDIRQLQQLQPLHHENRSNLLAGSINPLLMDGHGRMKNLEAIEKEAIQFALIYSGGCMTHAAKNLGIGRSTLYRRMHALNLQNYISRENQITRPTIRISSKAHS